MRPSRGRRPWLSNAAQCLWLATLALAALWTTGCEEQNTYVAPPPPTVTVRQPLQEEIVESRQYTGTTKPFESVEIRARVEGFLDSVEFVEGDEVEQGQLLFRIDPRPFEAAVARATAAVELAEAREQSGTAELSRAKAELANADAQLKRALDAQRSSPGAVSAAEIDELRAAQMYAQASVDSAQAAIESAQAETAAGEAEVTSAQLDLNYTEVRSPIDGRIGQKRFDVGSLVGTGDTSTLSTVVRYDPIYAYFTISETDFLRFNRERIEEHRSLPSGAPEPGKEERTIYLGLGDEPGFPHRGVVDYADLAVDESTGTYLARGRFDNPERLIPPGAFVRIEVPLDKQQALLIDEEAVGRDQGGAYLLVVNDQDVVEMRRVTLGGLYDGLQIVSGGELKPDDRVIVKGLQMARPDARVSPVQADDDQDTRPANAGSP